MISKKIISIVCACILSVGFIGAGFSLGKAALLIKKMNRVLTVKGLAEQDVKSDLGLWEINYREVGNDLVALNQRMLHHHDVVTEFLKQHSFREDEITRIPVKVEDRLANIYSQTTTPTPNEQRYVVTGGIKLRSDKVDLIQNTLQDSDQLLQQGVPLAFGVSSVNPNPSYYFTQLDKLRPTMLTQAITSARTVADQFSKESGIDILGIERASQGVFQIMSPDTSNESELASIGKKVRVVTTIDYRIR